MMYKQSYDEVLEEIISVDPRYHPDAYHFVREGLDYTQQSISKQEKGAVRHISGQELLGGMRAHALEQYGPMTLLVLDEWGVKRCEDFGEIVFNMVEHNLLAKTAEDSREDFAVFSRPNVETVSAHANNPLVRTNSWPNTALRVRPKNPRSAEGEVRDE